MGSDTEGLRMIWVDVTVLPTEKKCKRKCTFKLQVHAIVFKINLHKINIMRSRNSINVI